MEKTCTVYTAEQISRFVDTELPKDLQDKVALHLVHCPDCSRLVKHYTRISQSFNHLTNQAILRIDPEKLGQKIPQTLENSRKTPLGTVFGFFNKNIYLKLASITAILMISLIPFQGVLFGPSGPSAIVTSVDTDFTSVMIFETQKEKHTIIWFSET